MRKRMIKLLMVATLCLFLFPNMISANSDNIELQLNSEAVVLIDANSGQVLYEKNSQEKLPPASITKIATAIYAIEKGNLNDLVTVSENARNVEGTRVYLEVEEQVSLEKLIQGLLINSGNDAGVAIAEHLSGSVDSFVLDFNQYLQDEIGVENTNFTNPHGLYSQEHLTTAEDMAKITQYAMENETFREIFKTKELPWVGETWDTTIINHHLLVRDESYEGITGGKNGFVTESGFTLVTTAERENLSLIAVTLNTQRDEQVYEDTVTLLDYGFQHFETDTIAKNQQFEDELENKYITTDEISFSKKMDETIELEVQSSGTLVIKGEDGRIIKNHELMELKSKEKDERMKAQVVASPTIEDEIDGGHLDQHLRIIVPIALSVAFLISGIFYLQVRRL